jgi:hypothetical protein
MAAENVHNVPVALPAPLSAGYRSFPAVCIAAAGDHDFAFAPAGVSADNAPLPDGERAPDSSVLRAISALTFRTS